MRTMMFDLCGVEGLSAARRREEEVEAVVAGRVRRPRCDERGGGEELQRECREKRESEREKREREREREESREQRAERERMRGREREREKREKREERERERAERE